MTLISARALPVPTDILPTMQDYCVRVGMNCLPIRLAVPNVVHAHMNRVVSPFEERAVVSLTQPVLLLRIRLQTLHHENQPYGRDRRRRRDADPRCVATSHAGNASHSRSGSAWPTQVPSSDWRSRWRGDTVRQPAD